jgi:hypothetical protein
VKSVDRKFSSILDELVHSPIRDKEMFIEQRADQVVASVTNLLKLINESYDEEIAADLSKRLFNSIRTNDSEKFRRGIKSIRKGDK